MFTSKERSYLRSLAQNIEPIGQIGKGGISENQLTFLSEALEARELIKITVLNNSELEAREMLDELSLKLRCEVVCVIGKKIILYRYSHKKGIKHVFKAYSS